MATTTQNPAGERVRTIQEVRRLRAERGGPWPAIRAIRRRRPLLTALLVLAAPLHALWTSAEPARLLDPRPATLFVLPWALMALGVVVRVWGSGNLRKNQEITQTGVYQMVQHPLYTGSLSIFLAYFLTVGEPAVGIALFAALVLLVYYPTMLGEEEFLQLKFPAQAEQRARLPRLIPNVFRLPVALRTDRFTLRAAYDNLGLRTVWVLLLLPALLEALRWATRAVRGG